ncbi:hypothetical [Parasynechococcus marenigrum WH 8102]|uniref:Uncharacterized protein n=1 Tax=Parasynechococcus marenigrum (strain WH8102) TaxID=84588 RepID=Q7U7C3_PARMW|nr:hypothetical [Parasynechococcus marenigrum WH 8102]
MDRICHACVTNMGPFSALLHRGCPIDFTIQRQASFAWVAPSAPARSTDSTARQVRDAGCFAPLNKHSSSHYGPNITTVYGRICDLTMAVYLPY